MKGLNDIDLSRVRECALRCDELQSMLNAERITLRELVQNAEIEYFGVGGFYGYFERSSRSYETEDGYLVELRGSRISIEKRLPEGEFFGAGTRRDSGLSFGLKHFPSHRYGHADSKKYESIRIRMNEIQIDEIVINPFSEF